MSREPLPRWAFWCVAALIAAYQFLPPGYDGQDHAHRIVALADQIRAGTPSLLIEDHIVGSLLPTFVYYSILPYLPSVLLNLAGLPAFIALKLVTGIAALVLASGVRALIERLAEDRRAHGYLAGAIFLSANYVFGLWVMRVALAEIWVYCLVPWVVVALLRGRPTLVFRLLLVQLCAHPIVFGHALAGEALVALAFALPDWRRLARSGLPALLAALIVSVPFWLPQALWKDFILGLSGLPVRFADTLFSLLQMASPLHPQTLGIWLPIAVALLLVVGGRATQGRVLLLAAAFFASLAIQTQPLLVIAEHIPLLSQSLFVWRLMLPSAFVGFAALALGWPTARGRASRLLEGLTLLAGIAMAVIVAIDAPGSVRFWTSGGVNDDVARHQYVDSAYGWGVREFAPNYARLAAACDIDPSELQNLRGARLRGPIRATTPYLSIRGAPFGTVTYLADGRELKPRACGDRLVLGPLAPNALVEMSEAWLDGLLLLRLVVITVILIAFVASLRRDRQR